MSFFERVSGGNPFSTQVGQLIEQATDGSLASENWALNMEICDVINETDEGPKDAIRAIKKRLSTNVGKNYQVIMYSLTVLESAVKNCGRRFHVQVANKEFLGELIKIIGPKNDPPQAVQEKILSLIQTWADAFKGAPELKEVEKQYYDLKKKGIEFPMTDLDKMAPIHTPARSAPGSDPPISYPPQRVQSTRATVQQQQQQQHPIAVPAGGGMVPAGGGGMAPASGMVPAPMNSGPITLNQDQLAKLTSELDVVGQNCKVFNEMLTEMTPGQEDASDLELLQELNRTCRQMQQRIVELLDKVANEEVTSELLRVNDDLNNAFLRYERFERYRTGQTGQAPQNQTSPIHNAATLPMRPPAAVPPATLATPPVSASGDSAAAANLIDFDLSPQPPAAQAAATTQNPFAPPVNTNDISVQLASMNVGDSSVSQQLGQLNSTPANATYPPQQQDEFDMFAQSRQSFDTTKGNPVADSYSAAEQPQLNAGLGIASQLKSSDFEGYDTLMLGQELGQNPTNFDEMEKWLEENGPGAEQQESATSAEFDKFLAERAKEAENLPDLPSAGNNTNNRKIQKDDADNALFAL